MITPSIPSSPRRATTSRGKTWASSHSMTCGAISDSANSRTIFLTASWSSESWKPNGTEEEAVAAAGLSRSVVMAGLLGR